MKVNISGSCPLKFDHSAKDLSALPMGGALWHHFLKIINLLTARLFCKDYGIGITDIALRQPKFYVFEGDLRRWLQDNRMLCDIDLPDNIEELKRSALKCVLKDLLENQRDDSHFESSYSPPQITSNNTARRTLFSSPLPFSPHITINCTNRMSPLSPAFSSSTWSSSSSQSQDSPISSNSYLVPTLSHLPKPSTDKRPRSILPVYKNNPLLPMPVPSISLAPKQNAHSPDLASDTLKDLHDSLEQGQLNASQDIFNRFLLLQMQRDGVAVNAQQINTKLQQDIDAINSDHKADAADFQQRMAALDAERDRYVDDFSAKMQDLLG